jgi:type III pantothenate kinase
MLLAVDIGNSNIKFGLYDGETLVNQFSIETDRAYSIETLRAAIGDKLGTTIDRGIVCSVVPDLNSIIKGLLLADHGFEARFVANDWDLGLDIQYQPLSAAGTDRLVNCFSAVEKYGVPAVVCSFGTALTIDVVDKDRRLVGGLIAPGIRPLARALHLVTAQLPEVEIEKPAQVIQQTTKGSIQSGLVNGYIAMFTGLVEKVCGELGASPKVIATGGLAKLVAAETSLIDVVDRRLTLDGLQKLADRRA